MATTVLQVSLRDERTRAQAPCVPIALDELAAEARATVEAPPRPHTGAPYPQYGFDFAADRR